MKIIDLDNYPRVDSALRSLLASRRAAVPYEITVT